MRILLVSSGSGSRGGGEIFLAYLGQGLANRGHEVIVWIPESRAMNELAARCSEFGNVVRSPYQNTYDRAARSLTSLLNFRTQKRLGAEWASLQPDVIHLNKQNLEDGLDLLRAATHSHRPSICTVHLTQTAVYLQARGARIRDLVAYIGLRNYSGLLVAVQEKRSEELSKFLLGCGQSETVYNGVPIPTSDCILALRERKRRELSLKGDQLAVLGVGRLVEQKRPKAFLEAAKRLSVKCPNLRFFWIGDGPMADESRRLIKQQGLEEVVMLMGWQQDVRPFLAAGDLLLHVAEFEGLPFAVVEAMAAGLPCAVPRSLASEIPCFNADNVLFSDDLLINDSALRDRTTLARIAQQGRELAQRMFSIEAMCEGYERLYQKVKLQYSHYALQA